MSERQLQGKVYECDVIRRFEFMNSDGYTSPWDAYTKGGLPVQIKCMKSGRPVDLGDIFRNKNKNEDFLLIIGFYSSFNRNSGDLVIDEEYIIHIDHKKWSMLFEFDHYSQCNHLIKTISNDASDDSLWKAETKRLRSIWNNDNNRIIQIGFKRDHKNQKRIQCSIPKGKFVSFLDKFDYGKKQKIRI